MKKYKAGWLIDGSGRPPEKNMVLTVEGSKILGIGKAAASTPGDDAVLDFSNCTFLPGLIDAHVHLFMSGTYNSAIRESQLAEAGFDAVRGDILRRLKASLDNGIVAIRDGGDRHAHALVYKENHLDRRATPLMVLTAGKAWRRAGRYGKLIGRDPGKGNTLSAAIRGSCEKADHIKIVNSGLNSLTQFGRETLPQFSQEELEAAVTSAKEMGLKTMVHANGVAPVETALKAGCDSIEHGFFMGRDNLARMADQGTVWVPTAVTMQAYIEYMQSEAGRQSRLQNGKGALSPVEGAQRNLAHQLEQMAMARQLGVRVAAGTDAGSPGVDHGKSLRAEIGLLIRAGYSIPEAMKSATRINAQLLGLKSIGCLAVGDAASFVAVAGPPEDIPHSLGKIKGFFINGKQFA
jgi:imidazolonepropionase-like amidohydrolase